MGEVHLRRALLLFAIVLGLAALTASFSRPREERGREAPAQTAPTSSVPTETLAPGNARELRTLEFDASEDQVRRLEPGTAATLVVAVAEAGLVDIPALGATAPAEPLTAAQFDVLPSDPGRYELRFTPAGGEESELAGTLDVVE